MKETTPSVLGSDVTADFAKLFRYARDVKGLERGQPYPFEMWHAICRIWRKHGYHIGKFEERVAAAQADGLTPAQFWTEVRKPDSDAPANEVKKSWWA